MNCFKLMLAIVGLILNSCQPLKPSGPLPQESIETGSISFFVSNPLSGTSQTSLSFLVSVYKLTDLKAPSDSGVLKLQERFIQTDQLTLNNLTLGAKEFVVEASADDLDTILYRGSKRHQVTFGSQKIKEPLILRRVNFNQEVSIKIQLTMQINNDQSIENEITFKGKGTIEEKLKEYGCSDCHAGEKPLAGIGFDQYPFTIYQPNIGGNRIKNQDDVMERILGSIRHESGFKKMPVGRNKMTANDIKLFEIWNTNGRPINPKPAEISLEQTGITDISLHWSILQTDISGSIQLEEGEESGLYLGEIEKIPLLGEAIFSITVNHVNEGSYSDKERIGTHKIMGNGQLIELLHEIEPTSSSVDITIILED